MQFFTSDTHFNHANIIRYCRRPFTNVEEMNETIIANWNSVVTPDDEVFHLGDFGFGNIESILRRLNGKITLITGDHDKSAQQCRSLFEYVTPLMKLQTQHGTITLCHYSMRVWAKSHFNNWHLFGHSHGGLPPFGKSFDAGVDCNNFTPISLQQVAAKMATCSDNFNKLRED